MSHGVFPPKSDIDVGDYLFVLHGPDSDEDGSVTKVTLKPWNRGPCSIEWTPTGLCTTFDEGPTYFENWAVDFKPTA